MKYYIYINPINNKPYEFSTVLNDSYCIADNELQLDGTYAIKHYKPIILEIEKFDSSLLQKKYNPLTGKLE